MSSPKPLTRADLPQLAVDDITALRLAAIVESSDDAIVSKNLDGIIQTWNRAAERMFGYTADEAVGRSIRMVIPPDRQTEEDEVLLHGGTVRAESDGPGRGATFHATLPIAQERHKAQGSSSKAQH